VQEGHPVALQALHNEAFAAEEAAAESAAEGDVESGAQRGAEEGVFLADDLAAVFGHVQRDDPAREGSAEGDPFFPFVFIGKVGHEEGFAGDQPLACPPNLAEEAACRFAAVPHLRLEGDAVVHPRHCTRFGDNGLPGVELHLDDLEVASYDFVIDFVALHGFSFVSIGGMMFHDTL
jgi:hypothetical protein